MARTVRTQGFLQLTTNFRMTDRFRSDVSDNKMKTTKQYFENSFNSDDWSNTNRRFHLDMVSLNSFEYFQVKDI